MLTHAERAQEFVDWLDRIARGCGCNLPDLVRGQVLAAVTALQDDAATDLANAYEAQRANEQDQS